MPDEPEKSKNLPGPHRPRLSDLAKETTEEDLWDLEGGDMSVPTDSTFPPEPVAESEDTKTVPESKKSEVTEFPNEPRSMPLPPAAPKMTHIPGASSPARSDVKQAGPDVRNTPRSVDPASRPIPPKASRQNGTRPLDPRASVSLPSEVEVEPGDPTPTEAKATEGVPDQPVSNEGKDKKSLLHEKVSSRTSKYEKIGLIFLAVVSLGLTIWWLASLFSRIPTTRIGDNQPDLPAKGEFISIGAAETYWREPIREGARPDVARREVEFIPILNITIDDSEAGVIRVIYRNEDGDFIGDSISQSFTNGVFDSNANSAIEFPATDGFTNLGEFNGYRVGESRWNAEIFEGPSSNAPGSAFKLLFTIPISTNRQ